MFPVGLPDSIGTTAKYAYWLQAVEKYNTYDEQINTCTFITQRVLNKKTMNKKINKLSHKVKSSTRN